MSSKSGKEAKKRGPLPHSTLTAPSSPRELKTPVNLPNTPVCKENKSRSYVEQYHMQSLFREGKIQPKRFTAVLSSAPSKVWNRTHNVKKLRLPTDPTRTRVSPVQTKKPSTVSKIPRTESTNTIRPTRTLQHQRPLIKSKVSRGDRAEEFMPREADTTVAKLNNTMLSTAPPKVQQGDPLTLKNGTVQETKELPVVNLQKANCSSVLAEKTPESAVVLYHVGAFNSDLPNGLDAMGGSKVTDENGNVISEEHYKHTAETTTMSSANVAVISSRVSSNDLSRAHRSSPQVPSSECTSNDRRMVPCSNNEFKPNTCPAVPSTAILDPLDKSRGSSTTVRIAEEHSLHQVHQSPTKVILRVDSSAMPSTNSQSENNGPPERAIVEKLSSQSVALVAPIVSQVVHAAVQVELLRSPNRSQSSSVTRSQKLSLLKPDASGTRTPLRQANKSNSSVLPAGNKIVKENQKEMKPEGAQKIGRISMLGKSKAMKNHQDAPPAKKAKSMKSQSSSRPPIKPSKPVAEEASRATSVPRKQESVTVAPRIPRRPACPKNKVNTSAPPPVPMPIIAEKPAVNLPTSRCAHDFHEKDPVFELPSQDSLADPSEEFVHFSHVVLLYKAGDKMTGILRLTNNSSDGIFFRVSASSVVPERYVIDPKEGKLDPYKRIVIKLTTDGLLHEGEISGDTFKIETVRTPATSYTATRRFWMNVNPAKIQASCTKCIMRYHPQHPFFKHCIENSYAGKDTEEIVHLQGDGTTVKVFLKDLLEDVECAQQELIRLRHLEQGNFNAALTLVAISFFVVFYLLDLLPFSNFLVLK